MKDKCISNGFILSKEHIPKEWYNLATDLPCELAPYFNPQTNQRMGPHDMDAIFPPAIIEQEMTKERFIPIPDEVRNIYFNYRPSTLFRAKALEKLLDTPARIYYKYEGNNASGSHKLNTAIPQAYYNHIAGIKRIATETGAGQWGSAMAMATQHFDMDCTVYMVKVSYEQKPYRKILMQTFGADVLSSPTNLTEAGRRALAEDPNCQGSLGLAISEAVEDAVLHSDTNYSLGSVLNHVCIHQSIIGLEAKEQMALIDEYPDIVIACHGGGSNFAGIAFPFVADKLKGKNIRLIAAESSACPSLSQGVYAYDYGDTAKMTPISKMYTLGRNYMPSGIHAGGLRYHGASPIVSLLKHHDYIEAKAYSQKEVFAAALTFARSEVLVPAPESAHAIKCAIDEALIAKEEGKEKVILFNLSGHGHFDMAGYEKYLSGQMEDATFCSADMEKELGTLPKIQE